MLTSSTIDERNKTSFYIALERDAGMSGDSRELSSIFQKVAFYA